MHTRSAAWFVNRLTDWWCKTFLLKHCNTNRHQGKSRIQRVQTATCIHSWIVQLWMDLCKECTHREWEAPDIYDRRKPDNRHSAADRSVNDSHWLYLTGHTEALAALAARWTFRSRLKSAAEDEMVNWRLDRWLAFAVGMVKRHWWFHH